MSLQAAEIDNKGNDEQQQNIGVLESTLRLPANILLNLLAQGFDLLRPLIPKIIPLFICTLLIPLAFFFSASAGWVVWRSVAVSWESDAYLQYGDGVPPYAEIPLVDIVAQQPYDFTLHLVIPATDSNFALGNFMTTLTLFTRPNTTLTSIRRPAIVVPPSSSWLPFLSRSTRYINLEIPLLYSYVTGKSNVIASIELGRRDGWRSLGHGEGRELSVLSASLRGSVRHHGIRGLVTRYPLMFSILSTFTFLAVSLLILAACLLPMIGRNIYYAPPTEPTEEAIPDVPPTYGSLPSVPVADEDKPSRRRRSTSNRTRRKTIKTEAPTTEIPPASSGSSPLRRRRSQLSDRLSDSDG